MQIGINSAAFCLLICVRNYLHLGMRESARPWREMDIKDTRKNRQITDQSQPHSSFSGIKRNPHRLSRVQLATNVIRREAFKVQ